MPFFSRSLGNPPRWALMRFIIAGGLEWRGYSFVGFFSGFDYERKNGIGCAIAH